MKKLFLIVALVIFGVSNVYSQGVSFGATGGLFLGSADVELLGFDISSVSEDLQVLDGGGFYLGLLADIEVIESFSVQPELLYANVGGEGAIVVPIMAKYYVADKFNLQAGPQLDFVLDVPALVDEFVDTFGVSIGVGVGYDINDTFGIQAKYSFGLTNRLDKRITDALDEIPDLGFLNIDATLRTNIFQVGVIYKFN